MSAGCRAHTAIASILAAVFALSAFSAKCIASNEIPLQIDENAAQGRLTSGDPEVRYVLVPKKTATYILMVDSDRSALAVWTEDSSGRPLQIAESGQFNSDGFRMKTRVASKDDHVPTRFFDRIALEENERYELVIRRHGQSAEDLNYRAAVYVNLDDAAVYVPVEARRQMQDITVGSTSEVISAAAGSSQVIFRGRAIWAYRAQLANAANRWVTVSTIGSSLPPNIYFFDMVTGRVMSGTGRKESDGATLSYQEATSNEIGILVADAHDFFRRNVNSPRAFSIRVGAQRRNPNATFFEQLRGTLADPLVGLILGISVGAAISWAFYRRSIARKRLCYQTDSDITVMSAERTMQSRLRVTQSGMPISENVGWCTTTVSLKSHKDVAAEDVKEPVRLVFENISAILRVAAEGTEGWKGVHIPTDAPNHIQLELVHLKPGEWIRLDVFYTQQRLEPVSITSRGRILDGTIVRRRNSGKEYVPFLMGGIAGIATSILLVWFADNILDGLWANTAPSFLMQVIAKMGLACALVGIVGWLVLGARSPIRRLLLLLSTRFGSRLRAFGGNVDRNTVKFTAEPSWSQGTVPQA